VSVAASYSEEDLETAEETVVANFVKRVVSYEGDYILIVPVDDRREIPYWDREEIVRVARRDDQ
jgi:hypothetical protein